MRQAKLFLLYFDDIVRTVKSDPEKVLRAANLLHPNLQFRTELRNTNGKLEFSKLQVSIDKNRKVNCVWYKKPIDTGTIQKFKSCTPLQYKRKVLEGTVHRVFRTTSRWEEYDDAMKINREEWLDNQYPKKCSSLVLKRSSGRAKTKTTWLRKEAL